MANNTISSLKYLNKSPLCTGAADLRNPALFRAKSVSLLTPEDAASRPIAAGIAHRD